MVPSVTLPSYTFHHHNLLHHKTFQLELLLTCFIMIYPSSEWMVADTRKWQWKLLNTWFSWYNCWQTDLKKNISSETGKASVLRQNLYERAGWDQGHGSRPPGTVCSVHLSPLSCLDPVQSLTSSIQKQVLRQGKWYRMTDTLSITHIVRHVMFPSLLMTRCVNKWLSYGASVCN